MTDNTGVCEQLKAASCGNCGVYVALVPTDRPGLLRAMDFADDGYTPTETPHVCGVGDRVLLKESNQ
jgi:hypothetical protein